MATICQYCGSAEGHTEPVHTGDLEAEGGWELWFCCHPCRDAGQPCETFHPFPKEGGRAPAQEPDEQNGGE